MEDEEEEQVEDEEEEQVEEGDAASSSSSLLVWGTLRRWLLPTASFPQSPWVSVLSHRHGCHSRSQFEDHGPQ